MICVFYIKNRHGSGSFRLSLKLEQFLNQNPSVANLREVKGRKR